MPYPLLGGRFPPRALGLSLVSPCIIMNMLTMFAKWVLLGMPVVAAVYLRLHNP